MYDTTQKVWGIPAFDMEVPCPTRGDSVSREDLDQAIVRFLHVGPEEVHTATLADAIMMLWNRVDPRHRPHLLDNLEVFGEWKVERKASGERKDS